MPLRFARQLLLFSGLAITPFVESFGQVIHVPPVFRPVLHRDTDVLIIKVRAFDKPGTPEAKKAIDALNKTTFALQDDQLVITKPGTGLETIPLGDRKIRDIISELQVRYKDSLEVTSAYPLSGTSILKPTGPAELGNTLTVKANPDEPLVGLGFGVVFALADDNQSDAGGLLSDAGFQLDLTGSHQLVTPGKTANGFWPDWITAQTRLGINANQQLNVETEGQVNAQPSAGSQFGTALEQADQIALTGQLDFTFPLAADRLDMVLSLPSYGVSWTQLDEFVFPPILVADTFATAEAIFAQTPLEKTRDALERVFPLSEIGVNTVFQFRRNGIPVFYAGGGVLRKEIPVRRISFTQQSSDSLPLPTSIEGEIVTPMDWYWRAMFGARIAGVLDVRLDAAGPIGDREGEPLLRIVLGHAFPILKD